MFWVGCQGVFYKKRVWHLMEYLERNATNYFMYQWAGPVCPLPPTHQALPAPACQPSQRIALHQLLDLCSGQFALILRWDKSGAYEDFLKFKIAQYVRKTAALGTIRMYALSTAN